MLLFGDHIVFTVYKRLLRLDLYMISLANTSVLGV